MMMTNSHSIQDVLFFPQMRPEKKISKDDDDKYLAIGIPQQWIAVVQKMGYNSVDALKKVNPNKFHQELCGMNKKHKLELANPSVEDVRNWCK